MLKPYPRRADLPTRKERSSGGVFMSRGNPSCGIKKKRSETARMHRSAEKTLLHEMYPINARSQEECRGESGCSASFSNF